jgi:hypothetical protein
LPFGTVQAKFDFVGRSVQIGASTADDVGTIVCAATGTASPIKLGPIAAARTSEAPFIAARIATHSRMRHLIHGCQSAALACLPPARKYRCCAAAHAHHPLPGRLPAYGCRQPAKWGSAMRKGRTGAFTDALGADLKGRASILAYFAGTLAALAGLPLLGLALLAGVAAAWLLPDRRMEQVVVNCDPDD